MSIFGPKNFGKIQLKIGTPKIDTPKIDAFSSFEHNENAIIFGEGLYTEIISKAMMFGNKNALRDL